MYKELDSAFPASRFILTTRDRYRWVHSYQNMLANLGKASAELNEIHRILYDLPFPDVTEAQLIDRYERHNREVAEYFRDRPPSLLVIDWEKGDGWEELCGFLGRDVPPKSFPHMNKGRYQSSLKRSFYRIAKWLKP